MENAIRRTDFNNELSAWKEFTDWLRVQEDETIVYDCMMFELKHRNRPQFLDRARTRFNKLRIYRELKELEKLAGKVININYM